MVPEGHRRDNRQCSDQEHMCGAATSRLRTKGQEDTMQRRWQPVQRPRQGLARVSALCPQCGPAGPHKLPGWLMTELLSLPP